MKGAGSWSTIREEHSTDVAARETLLDEAYGAVRFTKTSERLREGRLPADGLSLVAIEHGRHRRHGAALERHGRARPARAAARAARRPSGPSQSRHRLGAGAPCHRRAPASPAIGAVLLVGDAAYYSRFGFTAEQTGGLWMPGRFERDRLLALELRPGALAGARGLIGATGRVAPTPDLATLIARTGT